MTRTTAQRRTVAVLIVSCVTALACLIAAVALSLSATSHASPADFGTAVSAPPAPSSVAPGRTGTAAATASRPAALASGASPGEPAQASTGLTPVRLLIPRLGVDAAVEAVGVAADGTAAIPENPHQVGWYRYGPRPGDRSGSAVIVGHVDFATGRLGVLAALGSLREGDRILVQDARGRQRTFVVRARTSVPKPQLAASGAFRRDGDPVLTLITCTGPYVKDRGGYQDNLVVTAVAEHP
ncbi:class F sortase [Streptacidiphilus sp. PAMC 29251]